MFFNKGVGSIPILSIIYKINKKFKYSEQEIWKCVMKCKNRNEFERKYGGMFSCAESIGIIKEILIFFREKRLKEGKTPLFFWNKETILDCAKKCENRKEFYTKYLGAYKKSLNIGLSKNLVFKNNQ